MAAPIGSLEICRSEAEPSSRVSNTEQDLKGLVEARNEKFMAFFKANDMEGLTGLYTEDCKLMAPGRDTELGRAGPERALSAARDSGTRTVELVVKEVGPMGSDVMYERGTYTMKAEDGKVTYDGKHVRVWKKVEEEWLMYIDIFNNSKT